MILYTLYMKRIGAKEKLMYLTRLTQGRLILEKKIRFSKYMFIIQFI